MAAEFPVYESGSPRPVLAAYIISTRDFLADLVQQKLHPNGDELFHQELVSPLREAWSEAVPQFQIVANETLRLTDPMLGDCGLFGAQLRFKLSVVRFLHRRYLEIPGVGPLRRLIDAIDTLLESILKAVGVGEGVKEIKDYIKHSLAP